MLAAISSARFARWELWHRLQSRSRSRRWSEHAHDADSGSILDGSEPCDIDLVLEVGCNVHLLIADTHIPLLLDPRSPVTAYGCLQAAVAHIKYIEILS